MTKNPDGSITLEPGELWEKLLECKVTIFDLTEEVLSELLVDSVCHTIMSDILTQGNLPDLDAVNTVLRDYFTEQFANEIIDAITTHGTETLLSKVALDNSIFPELVMHDEA